MLAEDGDIKKIWSGYSTHKCLIKLTERATTVRAKTEGEVSPISVEEIKKQL